MDDNKNLILAVVVSGLILFSWPFVKDIVFPPPPAPPPSASETAGQAPGVQAPAPQAQSGGDGAGVPTLGQAIPGIPATEAVTRDQAISQAPRVQIDTPRLSGSLNLQGARIDDLVLKGYQETLDDDSALIDLLQPTGGTNPYFVQFGWSGIEGAPDGQTVWTADRTELGVDSPVTLSWANPEGVTFRQVISVDENYMFSVTQEVVNGSNAAVSLVPYARIFRQGVPQTLGFYILHEGLIGVFDEVLEERDYDEIDDAPNHRESFTTTGGWMGITDKYWLVALVPDQQSLVSSSFLRTGQTEAQYHVNYAVEAVSIAPGETNTQSGQFFAGAKETMLLDQYSETEGVGNFDLAVDFGWFYFLTKPFFYAIHFLNGVLGNFGLAILAFTLFIKILFFPLANKSYKSMSKMKLLQPKIVEMRERLGDDKQKMQMEMMEMYKKEKVNPLSGCLPILVQIPVFFALYKVLFVTIEMRHAPFFGWIHDLSAPDPLGLLTLFGLISWDVPAMLQIVNIGVWPLIMGFTMWFQQKLNPPPADPVQAKIFGLMPIFFTFILGGFPAGLVIYWAWNNSLSILQQYVIMRRMGVAIGGGKAES